MSPGSRVVKYCSGFVLLGMRLTLFLGQISVTRRFFRTAHFSETYNFVTNQSSHFWQPRQFCQAKRLNIGCGVSRFFLVDNDMGLLQPPLFLPGCGAAGTLHREKSSHRYSWRRNGRMRCSNTGGRAVAPGHRISRDESGKKIPIDDGKRAGRVSDFSNMLQRMN